MRKLKKGWIFLLSCLLLAAVLTACAPAGGENQPPKPEDGVLTYAVLNSLTKTQERSIEVFNKNHPDARIEVLDYSDEGGIERLMTQLALGWVPDIMELHRLGSGGDTRPRYYDLGPYVGEKIGGRPVSEDEYWLPYRQLVRKGYLEDLWPYIENDPDLGREGVLEAPLKAAEIDGGLYMLFREVYINTLIGTESVVGDRDGWTIEELMETFAAMPDGSTILRYNTTRWDMYSSLFSMTLDRYIDWETGQCSFDNDEFRSMLAFLVTFPTEFKTALTPVEMREELTWRRLEGEQMLETVLVSGLLDIADMDAAFGGEQVVFVGYPTEDGSSGSFFNIFGPTLAMASTCRNKEVAWEFMRSLVSTAYTASKMSDMMYWDCSILMPINRKSFENGITADLHRRRSDTSPTMPTFPGGPKIKTELPTKENHLQRFEKLLNNTTQLCWPDDALSDIVWEAIGPYFAGDKTMDETIQIVQNRVELYVSENR